MTTRRLMPMVILFALWPSMVHAQEGWMEWLERLSGPGPFWGGGVSVRTWCEFESTTATDNSCVRDKNVKKTLVLRLAWSTSRDHSRFDDATTETKPVHTTVINPLYLVRIHPTLDVGAGAGLMVLTGDDFDPIYRFIITPLSVSFVPFGDSKRKAARFFKVRFEEKYLTRGISVKDNFPHSSSSYARGSEFLPGLELVFNPLVFLCK